MKYLILTCLLVVGVAGRDKQIKLEDIERDNLASERSSKQQNQYLPRQQQPAKPTTPPKMQYGFVPMKTPPNYQPQPQREYEYATQTETYPQEYAYVQQQQQQQQQQQPQTFLQYEDYPQYQYQTQAQPLTQQIQALAQSQVQAYTQSQPKQAYTLSQAPQAQALTQPQAVTQPQAQQYQYVPQTQQPVQYVVDNHLQTQQQQKYYTQPQYVYLNQYQSSSNNIHSVVDAKGNVQYVMYVPASSLKDDPNYQHLLQSYSNQDASAQSTPTQIYENYESEPQYYQEAQAPQKYTNVYNPTKPKESQAPVESYVYNPTKPKPQALDSYVYKPKESRQPTSLLDSYVPSYLQYQYYKQQQETANAIKNSAKPPAVAGKGEVVKSFRDLAKFRLQDLKGFRTLQDSTLKGFNGQVNYRLHHPASYLPNNVKQ